jgi:hypothetical protein
VAGATVASLRASASGQTAAAETSVATGPDITSAAAAIGGDGGEYAGLAISSLVAASPPDSYRDRVGTGVNVKSIVCLIPTSSAATRITAAAARSNY